MSASTLAGPVEAKAREAIGFSRILFATDFSEASDRALTYALAFVARYHSELFVVHATEPQPREPIPMDPLPRELDRERIQAERQMKHLLRSARFRDVLGHSVVQRGKVWDVLSTVIDRENIDLVIMGTHGRRGFTKLALGSVAEEVLHLAPCPVLTVGPNASSGPVGPVDFHHILFATDFGDASVCALPYAIKLTEDCEAQLVLLHMIEPMPVAEIAPAAYGPPVYAAQELAKWQSARRRDSEARLRELMPSDAHWAVPPVVEVGMDFLPEGVLETAKSYRAQLIVMGANRTDSPRLAAHFPWALTSEVIRKARCPVLTVRN